MKRVLLFALLIVAVISLGTVSEAKMVLKLGHYANAEHAGNKAAQMFAEGVAQRTNGVRGWISISLSRTTLPCPTS